MVRGVCRHDSGMYVATHQGKFVAYGESWGKVVQTNIERSGKKAKQILGRAQLLTGFSIAKLLASTSEPRPNMPRSAAAGDAITGITQRTEGKRKAKFQQTAGDTGATLDQVAYRFYELSVQKTSSGHYYQDASGNWQKK